MRIETRLTLTLLTGLLFACPGRSVLGVDSLWNFDGNLNTTTGTSVMAYRGNTATVTQFNTAAGFGLPELPGGNGTEMVMAFPATSPSQGYTVTHNGASLVNQYTMVWDILYPESSDIKWRSLLQTSQTNSNDGDFFVLNAPWGGVGISGQYHGAIRPGEWNRVAVTRNASGTYTKYINGGYVGEQDASISRFALDPTFHLFTDENNETAPGYVSSFRYLDRAMTSQELLQLGATTAGGAATPGTTFADPSTPEPGSYTIALLGDTQNYSQFYPNIYAMQTQWLADHAASNNIQMVLHVGDVVNFDDTTQWNNAAAAMSTLDGVVPYAIAPGNHDYANNRNVSQFNQANRFGPASPYAAQPTLDGNYPGEPNSMMNTFHTFEANGEKTLILALEFGPRDAVIDWARDVLEAHPDHRAILVTHAYAYDGGQRFDARIDPNDPQNRTYDQIRDAEVGRVESIYNPKSYSWATGANDGQDLWDKLVKDAPNMPFVITGHQFDERDGFPFQLSQAENGDDVYQILVDMQARENGGEGWIRFLEFSPDGTTVTLKSYSPFLDEWSYASDEYFTIQIAPATLSGDFDLDGDVDGSDFLAWQAGFGTMYDTDDLADWKANYGTSNSGEGSLASEGVPEPASWILLLCGVIATGLIQASFFPPRTLR